MYEEVLFEVLSTAKVPSVVFQLFAKGLLKISQIVPLVDGKANFTLIPKFSYTPKAHCIVFFISGDGEIVSSIITLHFENVLPNYVSLIAFNLNSKAKNLRGFTGPLRTSRAASAAWTGVHLECVQHAALHREFTGY